MASTDSVEPSPLLAKLAAFLPQLAAANEQLPDGRIDDGLVAAQSKDDSDDDDDASDDDDEPRAAKKARTVPTIQLDFAVGVDANHPVMSLLEGNNDDDKDGDDDNDNDKDGKDAPAAHHVVQNLLRRRPTAAAQGPLITEVVDEPGP
jgi:hypothetical protein